MKMIFYMCYLEFNDLYNNKFCYEMGESFRHIGLVHTIAVSYVEDTNKISCAELKLSTEHGTRLTRRTQAFSTLFIFPMMSEGRYILGVYVLVLLAVICLVCFIS